MKITCESCTRQYEIHDQRVPASGMSMTCPACLHTFQVVPAPVAAETTQPPVEVAPEVKRPREIALSELSELSPEEAAPASFDEVEPLVGERTVVDARAPLSLVEVAERVVPLAEAPAVVAAPVSPVPPPLPQPQEEEIVDLPAPRLARTARPEAAGPGGPPVLPPPRAGTPPASAMAPPPLPPSVLPSAADMSADPEEADLPAPARGFQRRTAGVGFDAGAQLVEEEADLVAPKTRRAAPGVELSADDLEDLDDEAGAAWVGPPPFRPEEVDLVAPKVKVRTSLDGRNGAGRAAPPPEPPAQGATAVGAPVEAKGGEPASAGVEAVAPIVKPPSRWQSWGRTAAVVCGIAGLVCALGGGLLLFTGGERLVHSAAHKEAEGQLALARRQLADDTAASYRLVGTTLRPFVDGEGARFEALALAAEARLNLARLGLLSELLSANALFAKLGDPKAAALPEVERARALRLVVTAAPLEARGHIAALLAKTPADGALLVDSGWNELRAGDPEAAAHAFDRAVAADPTSSAALYGAGLAKERLGQGVEARALYERALAQNKAHLLSAIGLVRTSKEGVEAQAELERLIAAHSASAGPFEIADAWASLGQLALAGGRRPEAQSRFERALRLHPDHAAALVGLASVRCDLHHCQEALAPLRKLLAAQPGNLEARLTLARALVDQKLAEEAATVLEPALKGVVTLPAKRAAEVHYWSAQSWLVQSRPAHEQALAALDAALAKDPNLVAAYVAKSNLLAGLARPEEALAALNVAQQQAAHDPELMARLGDLYASLDRPRDAEACLLAALKERPELHAARISLAGLLTRAGRFDEAAQAYTEVATRDPKYPGLLEHQAALAVAQGKRDEALRLYDQALTQAEPPPGLRLAAGALFVDPAVKRYDQARALAEAILKDDERSAPALLLLARALRGADHADEAFAPLKRAIALADTPEAHLLMGELLEGSGRLDGAAAELELATKPPVAEEARLAWARVMVRRGATKDALSALDLLVKVPALRAAALVLMGDCFSDLQQRDKARHAYQDAVKAAPGSGEAAFKLGRALLDAGRRHDAIHELERSYRLAGDRVAYGAELQLILGDAHRDMHERDQALKAYRRYLELAPADASARPEVERQIRIIGG